MSVLRNSMKVVIIDYGLSNLLSITRAFEHLGTDVVVTDDANKIGDAQRIVLPGVGAFPFGVSELKKRGFFDELKNVNEKHKTPILGICLGMQMMLTKGHEIEETEGLGFIEGEVVKLPAEQNDGKKIKVPHVAWGQLIQPEDKSWDNTIFRYNHPAQYMYFVHSYYAATKNTDDVLSLTKFGDFTFTSAFQKENVYGVQFHPEKSHEDGLKILKAFVGE